MSLSVGTHLGPYKILAAIGAGGMGEVYRATDTRLDRQVAVKVLPEHLANDPQALARFDREAKAVAALSHPNILAIHDFGSDQGITYAVSELLEGETLRMRLGRSALSWRQAVEIALAVSEGLSAAHSKGIVHRDLKPDNIFLTTDGQMKVLDFGLARRTPAASLHDDTSIATQTATGTIMGTPGYMSPEQVRGEPVGPSSDLFSLGCLLYEMLARRRAFARATSAESLAATLRDEPPPLVSAGHPPELDRIVARCLEKRPEARWQSARDLSFALKTLLSRPAASRRSGFRLRPAAFAIAGVLVLSAALIALIYGVPWKLGRSGSSAGAIRSLAVLPLGNLSGDSTQEYFADGMTEALISSLAQIRALKVISRTSVMRYKGTTKRLPEIASDLNVDAIVEGSVQRAGGRVRITAQLIQGATDVHLWAKEYEGDLADVLRLESDVARAIADEIRMQLTASELARPTRPVKPAAYEAYLLGRYDRWKLNEQDLKRAMGHFEEAIRLDPNYSAAYAGLAEVLMERGVWGDATFREDESRARTAALKAIELDEHLADGHVALAFIKYHWDWDWTGAEKEFRRAIELDLSNLQGHALYSVMLMAVGRFPESITQIEMARQLDPLSANIESTYGRILYRARKYGEAVQHLQHAIQLDPREYTAYVRLGDVFAKLGQFQNAIDAEEKARAIRGEAGVHALRLARIYASMGKRREALQALEEAKIDNRASHNALDIAFAYAALGDKDQAFTWLDKAVERRDLVIFLKYDPNSDSLRPDPRFDALIRRIGLAN